MIGTVLVLFALCIGGVGIYIDRMNAIKFEADGIVQEVKWDTKNHNMPLFKIKEEHRVKTLQDSRVVLQPQDIKVGDKFEKKAGSKECLINNREVICVK